MDLTQSQEYHSEHPPCKLNTTSTSRKRIQSAFRKMRPTTSLCGRNCFAPSLFCVSVGDTLCALFFCATSSKEKLGVGEWRVTLEWSGSSSVDMDTIVWAGEDMKCQGSDGLCFLRVGGRERSLEKLLSCRLLLFGSFLWVAVATKVIVRIILLRVLVSSNRHLWVVAHGHTLCPSSFPDILRVENCIRFTCVRRHHLRDHQRALYYGWRVEQL